MAHGMTLWQASLAQIGLPPWEFAADQPEPSKYPPGYFSKASVQEREALRLLVIETLRTHGPMYGSYLAEELEAPLSVIRAALGAAVKSQSVFRLEDGRYQVTEASDAR